MYKVSPIVFRRNHKRSKLPNLYRVTHTQKLTARHFDWLLLLDDFDAESCISVVQDERD